MADTVVSPVPVVDGTTPVPYTSFQVDQVLRPTTPPTATYPPLDTAINPALVDTQPNSISSAAAATPCTPSPPLDPKPLHITAAEPMESDGNDGQRADMLRLWSDISALSEQQRSKVLDELIRTQQPATLSHAHDQLKQLHALLLAAPIASHTITLPPPATTTYTTHTTNDTEHKANTDTTDNNSDKWKPNPQAGNEPGQPASTAEPATSASKDKDKPPPAEQHYPDRDVHKFTSWFISCLFPDTSDNTINHFTLNTPWFVVYRWLHTPIAFNHTAPTSWYNAIFTYIGVFTAIALIAILHQYYTVPQHDWPIFFASHGALATIIFTTPQNVVVLPYAMFGGTLISTFYAVLIQQNMNTVEWLWLALALSAAASITTMQLLGCSHPPGGALSVLYIAVPTLQVLGYWYIIAAEVGVLIMFLVALIVNNVPKLEGRRFPISWFS